jgi:hypothetical protein
VPLFTHLQAQEDDDEPRNELLSYIRQYASTQAHRFTQPGKEVSEAMDVFLQRLMGTDDMKELGSVVSETSSKELNRLLYWLMIVGYTLRSMEVRFSIEQSYALPYVALNSEEKGLRDNL